MRNDPKQSDSRWLARIEELTGIDWLVIASIMMILMALMLPATQHGSTPASRTMCKNNLKQIAIALHRYSEVHDAFPPAFTVDANGNRLHSWRTLILPYLEQSELYETIDLSKAWDHPANAEAYATTIASYRCPRLASPATDTTYVAVLAEGTVFRSTEPRSLNEIGRPLREKLMVVEVDSQEAVHWMSPYDGEWKFFLNMTEGSDLPHRFGVHGLFADGSVRFVPVSDSISERNQWVSAESSAKSGKDEE